MNPTEINNIVNSILKEIKKEITTIETEISRTKAVGTRHLLERELTLAERIYRTTAKHLVYDMDEHTRR